MALQAKNRTDVLSSLLIFFLYCCSSSFNLFVSQLFQQMESSS